MTVQSSNNPTLADWILSRNPDGSIADVAEVLTQTNEILDVATVIAANDTTSHMATVRDGLPAVYWRAFNQGIAPSKGSTTQVRETIAMMESRSEVDAKLARLGGDPYGFRWMLDSAHLEAQGQELAATMLYGNPAGATNEFMGLAPRYSSTAAGNGDNIILGGSATEGVNTSIWLVGWSPTTVFCVFPRGHEDQAGITATNLGEYDAQDVNGVAGTRMRVYGTDFNVSHGLVVQDWRFAVRIPNLQLTALSALSGVHAPTVYTNLLHLMEQALARMPHLSGNIRFAFMANRSVESALRRLAMEKGNSVLSVEKAANQFGTLRNRLSYQGIPILRVDALLNTEALGA